MRSYRELWVYYNEGSVAIQLSVREYLASEEKHLHSNYIMKCMKQICLRGTNIYSNIE